jgi:hypothetical protein
MYWLNMLLARPVNAKTVTGLAYVLFITVLYPQNLRTGYFEGTIIQSLLY